MVKVKICGITQVEDAVHGANAGADFLGLNFWPQGRRCCDLKRAVAICDAVRGRVGLVGVFVNASVAHVQDVVRQCGLEWIQLHGQESRDEVRRLGTRAYKAVGVKDERDVQRALAFPGDWILLDAKGGEAPGGTGKTFPWSLARGASEFKRVWLAGGLTPDNVAEAIVTAAPHGVDVASGVESAPGKKDAEKVRAFVRAATGVALG